MDLNSGFLAAKNPFTSENLSLVPMLLNLSACKNHLREGGGSLVSNADSQAFPTETQQIGPEQASWTGILRQCFQ